MYRKLVNTAAFIFSPGLNTAVGQSALLGVSGYFCVSKHTEARKLYIVFFYPSMSHLENYHNKPEYPARQYKHQVQYP